MHDVGDSRKYVILLNVHRSWIEHFQIESVLPNHWCDMTLYHMRKSKIMKAALGNLLELSKRGGFIVSLSLEW